MRALFLILLTGSFLAGCAPQDEGGPPEDASAGEAVSAMPSPDGAPAPDTFAQTAWMARAKDGARYVTQLDADGTYRDLRNGDAWQSGSWSFAEGPEGKQLCFSPEDEAGVERCWLPGRMKEGKMMATGPGGRRIELEPVTYEPPEQEDNSEE